MKKHVLLLAVTVPITLTACETILTNLPGVYSIDIEQGNMIDQSMIDQLRPNMTKRQVLYIMGSPMLADTFHQKRWDYLYSDQPGGEARQQKRVSLFFNGDNLVGVQGDFRPSAMPVVKESTEATVDIPKRDLDTTMWEKVTGIFSDDQPGSTLRTEKNKDPAEEPVEQKTEEEKPAEPQEDGNTPATQQ